jgi:hypothetical protein
MTAATAVRTPTVGAKPLLATLVGIPVAVIALAAARGEPVPVLGSYEAGLVALFVLGSVMCSWGMQAMAARHGYLRASLVGAPIGVVNLVLILSGLFGWTVLLGPATAALGGEEVATPAQAAIVSLVALMVVKWAIAWLAYLPRSAPRG